MARFITTKADFTLRRKHKTASGMTVYENDYTTINPMPNAFKNEYVIGDSNFKFTTRYGINGQRKHTRGRFIPNPTGEASAWTMDTLINSAITPETKIKLKPNYTSIRDFACYGSAEKLIQGTINGVIADFPAEMYFSEDKLAFYKGDVDGTYSFDNTKELSATENIIYNEYNIDIISTNVREEDAYNPMRFFALCGTSHNFMSGTDEYEIISFTPNPMASGSCVDGTPVEVEKINEVEITFRISTAQTGTVGHCRRERDDTFVALHEPFDVLGCRGAPRFRAARFFHAAARHSAAQQRKIFFRTGNLPPARPTSSTSAGVLNSRFSAR